MSTPTSASPPPVPQDSTSIAKGAVAHATGRPVRLAKSQSKKARSDTRPEMGRRRHTLVDLQAVDPAKALSADQPLPAPVASPEVHSGSEPDAYRRATSAGPGQSSVDTQTLSDQPDALRNKASGR